MEEAIGTTRLGVVDLIVMFGTIGLAIAVGIYFAIVDRKKSVDNYYFGGRAMSPVAVAMSIAVSFISAITVIGFPAEVYLFGTVLLWFGLMSIVPKTVACIYYIPLIHKLRLETINEYLELRFHRYLRKMVSGISIINLIKYMGTTVYLPALAINAVTSLSLFSTIIITSFVCTCYTTLGGMKAVIWTDVIQTIAMVVGGLAAMIRTVIRAGGFGNIYPVATKGGRMNLWTFDPDPTIRYSVWTFIFGIVVTFCHTSCINQAISQRYLSCGTVNKARMAALLAVIPSILINAIAVVTGMAMYAYYEGCDPLKSKQIAKPDQILPHLVVEIFQDLPGMAGLFIAAAFSGTLSTVSSGLNSMSVLILHDFILPIKPNLSDTHRLTISKIIVIGIGLIVMGFTMGLSYLDATVLQIGLSITGALNGPLLGVFTLGVFFPWSTVKGTVVGQIVATAFTSWIAIGSLLQGTSSSANHRLPTSIEKCPSSNGLNLTTNSTSMYDGFLASAPTTDMFTDQSMTSPIPNRTGGIEASLYSISYMYFGTISLTITVVVGLAVSFITGANDPKKADSRLFVPILDNPVFPEQVRKFFRFGVPVENAEKKAEIEELKVEFSGDNKNTFPKEHLDKESVM